MTHFSLLSLLNGNNFGFFNRELAHLMGLHEAIIFSELVSKHEAFEEDLIEIDGIGGYFYCTFDEMFQKTAIHRKPQDSALNSLITQGWIEKKNYGLPMKRYFRINTDKIFELLTVQKKLSKLSKTDKLGCPFGATKKVQNGQTAPYIYKNTREEKESTKESASLIARAPHVSVSSSDHEKLIELVGEEMTQRCYERLSLHKEQTPKSKWKKGDYLSIRNWVIDALQEQDVKKSRIDQNASKMPENRIKQGREYIQSHPKKEVLRRAANANLISIEKDHIAIMGQMGGNSVLSYMAPGIEDQIDSLIHKLEGRLKL